MSSPIKLVPEDNIVRRPPISISWEIMLDRLSQIGIVLGSLPDKVVDSPIFRGSIILNSYFNHQVLTKEEARYLLVRLTDLPDNRIITMVEILDKTPEE